MTGLGYRREMRDWDMSAVAADFFEVAPENWIDRDRAPLHRLLACGRPVQLHGVSLNLGGTSAIDPAFVRQVRALLDELGSEHYSDHLAASGDAHQLYDLFPIPFTPAEARRVADRIARVQDLLGRRIAVENSTWYTNVGELDEPDFLMEVVQRADTLAQADPRRYLFGILKHKITDRVRRKYRPEVGYDEAFADELDNVLFNERDHWVQGIAPQAWTQPDEQLKTEQFFAVVDICVHKLPAKPARVFSMKEILECEPEEICSTLGLSKADYWQCMSRARKQIQLCLNENWFAGAVL